MTIGKHISFICVENGNFPNNSKLNVQLFKNIINRQKTDPALFFEHLFQQNEWPPAWRNGLYDFHHFHSNSHEVLGVYSGWVNICFGGPRGVEHKAEYGDVLIIPAGVSHKNMAQATDFRTVGAYPKGQQWNMKYGQGEERPQVDQEIAQVPFPLSDPVYGSSGPLLKNWQAKK